MFLSTSNKQRICCFHKSKCTCLCYFYHMRFIQRWLIGYFLKVRNLIGLLEFHLTLSEILLTACADQLIYNLIKLYSTCGKQNTAVNESDSCSLLAKQTLSNLVGQRPSSLIINFKQVIKSFLVWNIYNFSWQHKT